MSKTGATRYQKFLKSEKAKTKLKAKKDLPKGTNVTKTNFKVKKIVIKEQLRKHGATEALSTRKLNVKELLSRLNHFNTNSRKDALDGLTELLTTHPEVLGQNLGQLVLGVTPMILNVEKVVRRDSFKVLHIMLSTVELEKIDPFFDIMSTFLRSAMTHIDSRIQEDSLLFLDILLQNAPNRVAQDFYKIIPNFLDMISKMRVDSKPGRTLTVNMGSQITSVKWRIKVLHRLQDYLEKFNIYNNMQSIQTPDSKNIGISKFDANKLNYFPLFNASYISTCHLSCFSSKKSNGSARVSEVNKFIGYIDTLMPLLFETWLEVCPNLNSDKNIETVVNEDAALLLKHILYVIQLLWNLVVNLNKTNQCSDIKTSFIKKYSKLYTQHFIYSFPYVTNVRTKQKNESASVFESVITDPKLVEENLEICHLYILFKPNVNMKSENKEIAFVLNYIEKIVTQNSLEKVNDIIIKILNVLFSNQINNWNRSLSTMNTLFANIVWVYFNKNISNIFKQKIFSLLCKIALNDKLSHFHQTEGYKMWLKNLPDILLQESISFETVNIMHKFAVQNTKIFNSVINTKLAKIVENLPKIVISDAGNGETDYFKLFSILFWIRNWDNDSLNLLEKQLLDGVYKESYGKYIFDTLKLRTGNVC